MLASESAPTGMAFRWHSIDAAATLVPAGLQGYVGICGNRLAGVWRKNEPTLEAKHDVPAIALCIAALNAGEP